MLPCNIYAGNETLKLLGSYYYCSSIEGIYTKVQIYLQAQFRSKGLCDVCQLGLGPGFISTLTAIAKWECSSYGRALALHARGTSLEAEQDNGNITKTQSKATPNESSSLGTTLGGGPRCQETMGDIIAQTRFENVSKHSKDSLLARGNTLQSDEDSLQLNELIELCTNLQQRVLDLEKTKTTQQNEIGSLKRRVKKLEQKKRLRTHGLKRLHKVGMSKRVQSSSDEEDLGKD
ncbi:hypothetical protein Tco_0471197, partial [Tanacetum coccineum]